VSVWARRQSAPIPILCVCVCVCVRASMSMIFLHNGVAPDGSVHIELEGGREKGTGESGGEHYSRTRSFPSKCGLSSWLNEIKSCRQRAALRLYCDIRCSARKSWRQLNRVLFNFRCRVKKSRSRSGGRFTVSGNGVIINVGIWACVTRVRHLKRHFNTCFRSRVQIFLVLRHLILIIH
jgi:hypothetical protein